MQYLKDEISSYGIESMGYYVIDLTQVGLLNKQAHGQLKVEELQRKSEVLVASTSPAGKDTIRNEVRALQESFDVFFKDVQAQKDQLTRMMVQWREYKVQSQF